MPVLLFTLTLASVPEVKRYDSTADAGTAATALNGIFGGTPFVKDLAIGDRAVRRVYLDDVR